MNTRPPHHGGEEGGHDPERKSRWERRIHLRSLEALVYDGWNVPAEVYQTLPQALIDIATDTLQSTRDRIRATEALSHLIQHRTETAVQLDRIMRLDAGQATDRVQLLEGLSDAQMLAVAQSLSAAKEPPVAKHKPRRGRTSRP